jgi:hypothetical protein
MYRRVSFSQIPTLAAIRAGNGAAADHAATAAEGRRQAMLDDVTEVDIGNMDYPTLSALRQRVEEKVREMREVGGPALREKRRRRSG